MNHIIFKGLGLEFFINPVAITLFNITIHWYGIIIAAGFSVALMVALQYIKYEKVDADTFLDALMYAVPSAVVGARLYYVLFNFSFYSAYPLEIFKLWNGGLAIYGAIIGALIAGLIFCKVRRIKILPMMDPAAPAFAIAQSIGRWGNFVNQEAYGSETNVLWGMTISENGIIKTVHPTFFYESMWNLFVFITLLMFYKHKKQHGEVFLLYISLYSLGRFFIEGLRTDSLYLGTFRISQVLAALLAVCGFTYLYYLRRKNTALK